MIPLRILIVDDHAVVRRGLRRYIELVPNAEIVAEAESGLDALALAPALQPDLVFLDLKMPGLHGIATAAGLRHAVPQAHIIVLTSFCTQEDLVAALRAGVHGFLLKDVSVDELILAIQTVRAGKPYLQPCVAEQLISSSLAPQTAGPQLTEREQQVYTLIADGLSNKQIAARLSISDKTISVHVSNLMGKLGLRSRTQVALYALQTGPFPAA